MVKPPIEIDILQHELENKLPYWLDPIERYGSKKRAEILKKHSDRHRAERADKRRMDTHKSKESKP